MKKYVRITIAILLLAALGIGYYYYLSNRTQKKDATDVTVSNDEMAVLTTRDFDNNYPESVKEVVRFYMRITKQYYADSTTTEQVSTLGSQARKLFDSELKSKQTDSAFQEALQKDVEEYKAANRYISDFKLQESSDVKYYTFQDKKYAEIVGAYYIREGSKLEYSYTKFTLRQDSAGRWKILFWELADEDDI
jgi:hypothetical protein